MRPGCCPPAAKAQRHQACDESSRSPSRPARGVGGLSGRFLQGHGPHKAYRAGIFRFQQLSAAVNLAESPGVAECAPGLRRGRGTARWIGGCAVGRKKPGHLAEKRERTPKSAVSAESGGVSEAGSPPQADMILCAEPGGRSVGRHRIGTSRLALPERCRTPKLSYKGSSSHLSEHFSFPHGTPRSSRRSMTRVERE